VNIDPAVNLTAISVFATFDINNEIVIVFIVALEAAKLFVFSFVFASLRHCLAKIDLKITQHVSHIQKHSNNRNNNNSSNYNNVLLSFLLLSTCFRLPPPHSLYYACPSI